MTQSYKKLYEIDPETLRDIVLGGSAGEVRTEAAGIMAPETIPRPQPRPDNLGPRFVDTRGAIEESILGVVAEELGRNATNREAVADAIVPPPQMRPVELSEWESMPPVEEVVSQDTTREALGSAPETSPTPEMRPDDLVILEDLIQVEESGFRTPENFADGMSNKQRANYNMALRTAREAGLSGTELAQYMAQLGHESHDFRTAEEYASGAAYEGRTDLGNTQPGDGRRYKGRGYIQLTGRENYRRAGEALGLDLINNPEMVAEDPEVAAAVSLWYWRDRVQPGVEDFNDTEAVTRIINGGMNGYEDRLNKFRQFSSGAVSEGSETAVSESLVPRPRPQQQD